MCLRLNMLRKTLKKKSYKIEKKYRDEIILTLITPISSNSREYDPIFHISSNFLALYFHIYCNFNRTYVFDQKNGNF
jgi:hypothetical protein